MITNKIDVIRDDVPSIVEVENIVPGDIVKLSSGDMIPGDVRFLETKDLFIDQSSLTGESNPVEKFSELKEYDSVTDISNHKNAISTIIVYQHKTSFCIGILGMKGIQDRQVDGLFSPPTC